MNKDPGFIQGKWNKNPLNPERIFECRPGIHPGGECRWIIESPEGATEK